MGGQAIAEILSGAANPSGRLPVTFPVSEAQLPHPKIEGDPNGAPSGPVGRGGHYGKIFTADLRRRRRGRLQMVLRAGEKAALSVRLRPLLHDLLVERPCGEGQRPGGDGERDRAQRGQKGWRGDPAILPLRTGRGEHSAAPRGVGEARPRARPGPAGDVTIDPRLLANFDEGARKWRIRPGAWRLTAGFDAGLRPLEARFELPSLSLPP